MPAERLETVRKWADAFNRREWDAIVAGIDPDVELSEWPTAPGARTYQGPEGIRQAFTTWFEAWEWMQVEIESMREVGDNVLVQLHQRAKGKGSEVEVEIKSFNVYTFNGPRISRLQLFTEEEPALEATVGRMLLDGYEAFNRNDYGAFIETLNPDVRWEHNLGSGAPEEGIYHGREEVLRLMERLRDAWAEQSYTIADVARTGPDEYRITGVVRATGKTSNLELLSTCEWLMEFRDGKAIRVRFALTGPAAPPNAGTEPHEPGVDVIRAVNDAVASRDMQAIGERLHESIVWEHNIGGGSPEEGVYHGRENVIALFERILEPWEILRFEVQEIIELGEGLVQVRGEIHFKHRTSAADVTEPYAQLMEVRDGLLIRGEMAFGALAREWGRPVAVREERSR